MKKYNTLIFDLDGTLIDTLNDVACTMNYVLNINRLEPRTSSDYRRWISEGTRNMVLHAAQGAPMLDELYNQFIDHYEKNLFRYAVVYEGIHSLLHKLVCQSTNLCVLSNKAHSIALSLCEEIFPGVPFKVIQGVTIPEHAKPNPIALHSLVEKLGVDIDDCLLVGDTRIDIETGKNAGCATMAVTWGYDTAEHLEAYRPDYLVRQPHEISEHLTMASPLTAF